MFSMNINRTLLITLLLTYIIKISAENSENEHIVVILFMFFGIGIGIIFMQILNYIGDPIPYTCAVFFGGILFSLANDDSAGVFGHSIRDWISIDAELLLFVFLPPLIFGEAMSLNWYHAKGALVQSLILAGPGVLMGAALMGCLAKGFFPQWGWNLAMTFGAILSATDPVAVVALLKSAGASPKLTIIIVGESLLNDGTAMVLFEVFFNALNGEKYTGWGIIAYFVAATVGSTLFGITIGFCTLYWLRTANRSLSEIDVLVQIAITLCSAYMTFYVAQSTLGISGVIACCGAGIVLARLAPPIILSHETMHHVWGMIEWAFNTMIFLLAGLIIGNRIFSKVRILDWVYLFVLYIFLFLIRAFVIAIHYPLVSTMGWGCTLPEAIFMCWGGLRGALGMALALIVYKNGPEDIQSDTSVLFFYVGGIAALTLVINATTAKSLLLKLGLLGGDEAEKELIMTQIKKKLKKELSIVLQTLAKEYSFNEKELDEVRQSCTLLSDTDLAALMEIANKSPHKLMHADSNGHNSLSEYEQVSSSKPFLTIPSNHTVPVPVSSAPAPISIDSFSAGVKAIKTRMRSLSNRSTGGTSEQLPTYNPMCDDHLPPSISEEHHNNRNNEDNGDNIDLFSSTPVNRSRRGSAANGSSVGHDEEMGGGRGRRVSAADHYNRRLSVVNRGPNPMMTAQLLKYVRSIFLAMVRVRYWHDIEQGKLPRKSKSAKFLLYSIEVGQEDAGKEDGAGSDWRCIERKLNAVPLDIKVFTYIEDNLPMNFSFEWFSRYLNKLECNREERYVYILTSFIAAHEHAQEKIHDFIKMDDDDMHSPEELKVIAESIVSVNAAKQRLYAIKKETVAAIRTKQAAALILTREADMVKHMMEEGLLTRNDAEEILEQITNDMKIIDKKRNLIYKEHGGDSSTRKKAELRNLDTLETSSLLQNEGI